MGTFNSVSLYNHRGAWNLDEQTLKQSIKGRIEVVNHKHRTLDIYLMHQSNTIYGDSNSTIRLFVGATPGEYETIHATVETKNATYALVMNALNDTSKADIFVDENGSIVAYSELGKQSYYIPFELAGLDEETVADVILHAVDVIVEKSIGLIEHQNSWIKTPNKREMVKRITDNFSGSYQNKEQDLKRRMQSAQGYIDRYRRDLKERYDDFIQAQKELEALKFIDNSKEIDNFLKGLDQIATHPKVSELTVDGDLVVIKIDEVYAYAENRDGDESRYYIGNMRVEININNTDVRFYGDNKRRGYWGQDPHPHVNGSTGQACLGNVSASIAELCSQKEIYGLFLIAMDFLENANVDDPAGRKIYMWDEVDEDGNIIREGGEEYVCDCDQCGEGILECDDVYSVYTGFDDGVYGEESWCEGCKDDRASWSDYVEEYVHDDIVDDIEEYYSEEEEGTVTF